MGLFQEMDDSISELDFTGQAEELFFNVVDGSSFQKQNLYKIYNTLKEKARVVPFGDFLKRYIYEKAELTGDYREIPTNEYCDIICASFLERQTPAGFSRTTAHIRNLARNWLKQNSVDRTVVLLLGFGLGMSTEDVDLFLIKALREQRLNAKDPFEVICWYCYTYELSYVKFEQLWNKYQRSDISVSPELKSYDSTAKYKQHMIAIRDEEQLMRYLKSLPIASGTKRQSVRSREQFDKLYTEVRQWIAEFLNESEDRESWAEREKLSDKLDQKNYYSIYQKEEMLHKLSSRIHNFTESEISPAQVEQFIFASIPKDKNGNLIPMKKSLLNIQFSGARMNRQHLWTILSGEAPITRYDLITMGFLAFIRNADDYEDRRVRFWEYDKYMNNILNQSDMHPLYLVNPYESFIAMCILSDDPLGTFADVWGLSYDEPSE